MKEHWRDKMPKTTINIVDWWDEGDNDDSHKDNKRWWSEEEMIKIKGEAYELGVDVGYLEKENEMEIMDLKSQGLI